MKRLAIGLIVLMVLLAVIVFSQKDKIKKIREIKQGAVVSEQNQTASSDKRIDEIIATAKKKQADQKGTSRIADELTKKLINCSESIDRKSCVNLIQRIAKDEKIILALEKLNKAGVGVIITWYKPDRNQSIYINEYGSLMIHEEADIQDIKKFFGLK